MSNMTLTSTEGGNFEPHPDGVHSAVCLDVMDLGLVTNTYQGETSIKPMVKIVFESEAKTADGKRCTVSKRFTASLHPKSNLWKFLGQWRGKPVGPNETIELAKLVGACCTVVVSHQKSMAGKTYAKIDAVSKPVKKIAPSGLYDPIAARQRYADWQAKQGVPAAAGVAPTLTAASPENDGFDDVPF